MIDLSTVLPQQFEGFCQGLETTPLGLQRMRYSLESRMRPRSDATVLESSLADLVDVCVPLKQAFAKLRRQEAQNRHSRDGDAAPGEMAHSIRAIISHEEDSTASDALVETEQNVLAQLRGSSGKNHGNTGRDTDAHDASGIWATATGKVRRLMCAPHL